MKLTGQASKYWTNVESYEHQPVETWTAMKDKLKGKYVSPSYYARLLDKWHRFSQGNKSAKEYVAKFDEFLIRCSVLSTEGETQIIFRFL